MNIFEDGRFVKKLNNVFDLLHGTILEIPCVHFKDDEGYSHKLEFLWFKIQDKYWMSHVAFIGKNVCYVEHWTFDDKTREVLPGPKCRTTGNLDKSIECINFNMNDLLIKMDVVIVGLI